MGSINKGSFKLNKVVGVSKNNNSKYNQSASTYGNSKGQFKDIFRVPAKKFKTSEIKKEE